MPDLKPLQLLLQQQSIWPCLSPIRPGRTSSSTSSFFVSEVVVHAPFSDRRCFLRPRIKKAAKIPTAAAFFITSWNNFYDAPSTGGRTDGKRKEKEVYPAGVYTIAMLSIRVSNSLVPQSIYHASEETDRDVRRHAQGSEGRKRGRIWRYNARPSLFSTQNLRLEEGSRPPSLTLGQISSFARKTYAPFPNFRNLSSRRRLSLKMQMFLVACVQ